MARWYAKVTISMLTSTKKSPWAGLLCTLCALTLPSCVDAGLHDSPEVVKALKSINALSDDDIRLVKANTDGHIGGLNLMGKDISDVLPHLDGLKRLRGLKVDVEDYSVEEIRLLGELKTLTHLTIACRDEHLPVLQSLTNMEELKIIGNDIQDSSLRYLASMKGMRKLNLEGAPISGIGFRHLKDFVALQELNVGSTKLNDDGITALIQNFPRLKTLVYCDSS